MIADYLLLPLQLYYHLESIQVHSILINLSCISIFIGALHKDVFCHSLYYDMEEKTGKQHVINTLFMYTATVECQKPFLVK